ncbi:hypothetical protein CHS0354_027157 [Potamilus streckersoni]|uniref:NFX1-type zinc finger-containing protein 1 n=1 Tax=Potamilus streckersoni TaxID=2493646 RepID=A0AAE0WEN0_9BIVA|nr:hypothetical protein CHS0354_027157 [Potamilus streckersoni]
MRRCFLTLNVSVMENKDNEVNEMYPIPIYMIDQSNTDDEDHNVKQNEHEGSIQKSHLSYVQQTSEQRFQKRGNIYFSNGRGRGHRARPQNIRSKEKSEPRDESQEIETAGNSQNTATSEFAQNPEQSKRPGGSSYLYRNSQGIEYHGRGQRARRDQRHKSRDEIQEKDSASNLQDTSNYSYSRGRKSGRTVVTGRGFYHKRRVQAREHETINRPFQESSPISHENLMSEYKDTTKLSKHSTEKKQHEVDDSAKSSVCNIGYKALKEILEMEDVEEIVLKINNVRGGFPDCIRRAVLKPDWIVLIVSIFQKACLSRKSTYVLDAFHLIHSSHFLDKVANVLSEVQLKSMATKGIWADTLHLYNFLDSLLCVLKKELELIPDSLVKCNNIIVLLNEVVKMVNNADHNSNIVTKLRTLDEMKKAIIQERDERDREEVYSFSKKRQNMEDLPPPDNFREISILPEMKDLQWNENPFLRANKAEGKYKSLDDYLDIQFRLLREDYVKPLRDGIGEYRLNLNQGDKLKKLQGLRLYYDVNVCRPQCSSSGLLYILQFNVQKFKNINWTSSRRLLHGSLVALTNDNFNTILFATVTNRDARELVKGFVQVRFENQLDRVINITPNEIFVMAETPAYFEAYRHILKGLQEIQNTMPFQKYFVECQMEISPPKYLLGGVRLYDFTPLIKQATVTENCTQIGALTTTRWPTSDELGLDASQYKALQTALTKELAVIQGPPGTGKTFVGLKITELLLHNHSVWKPSDAINPMLIVCYTNHALDQFLEGIQSFCPKDIVRIGGRCNNEALKPFVLRELKIERRKERHVPSNIYRAEAQCRYNLKQLRENIEAIGMKLQVCLLGILLVKKLKEVMTSNHFESLIKGQIHNMDECLLLWLGVTPTLDAITDAENLEDSLQTRWTTAILQTSVCMDMHEADKHDNVWNLSLVDRARMYKLWVQQTLEVLKNRIDELNVNMTSHAVSSEDLMLLEELKQIQSECQISIVNEQILKTFLQEKSQKQIKSLSEVPNDGFLKREILIEDWLCLTETFKNEPLIKYALKEIEKEANVEETGSEGSDIEEDRAVDDDDEDLFPMENTASSMTHTQNLNPRLIEDLAFMFSIKNKNENQIDDARNNWKIVLDKNKVEKKLKKILNSASSMSEAEAMKVTDIWSLPTNKRHELYRYWLMLYRQKLKMAVCVYENEYTKEINKLQEVYDDECLSILKSCKIIGMTTTGAAKYRHLIQSVKPKIIIVEEAAEVLESHIVTTLNPECQHLILIGDHQQLRPTPCVYELAKKYQLDISLFERLVKNGINWVTLLEQHRMRPEISVLVRHIYPNLIDHSLVKQYGNVKGLERNIFFIEHINEESYNGESRSYSNEHEAKFMSALAKQLLKQGYKRSQITILTPYVGQVLTIRRLLPKKEFEGLRVTAVDNFQGEENDIILLSLVRSTRHLTQTEGKKNPIGFLSIDNRVCVALSRAKMGFYVIGNFQLLLKYSDLWRKIVTTMQGTHGIGSHLSLACQVHGATINVACEEDFDKSPDGGCKLPCNAELPNCQHRCKRYCHVIDLDHNSYKCFQACNKMCEFGHKCKKQCFQTCGQCEEKVEKVIPMCKHKELIPCHMDPFTWKCKAPCKIHLACGHVCKGVCYLCAARRFHQEPCREDTEVTFDCGHVVKIPCFMSRNDISCPTACFKELPCSHKCAGTCGECFGGKLHRGCDANCNRFHSCGHRCQSKCSSICPPCSKRCKLTCPHDMQCLAKCGEKCTDCYESCAIKCEHGKCSKLCHEACDFRCDWPCLKKLKCKHLCKGLCGEECLCTLCDKQTFSDVFDTGISEESIFIRLYDCRCILEISGMDEWMKTNPGRGFLLSCPKCRRSILKSRRYKDVIKKSFLTLHETYKQTYGTDQERRITIMELKRKIPELTSIGCNDSEQQSLMRCLETEPLASLDYLNSVRTRIKYLSCILNIERFVQIHIDPNCTYGSIHTAKNSLSKYRYLLAQDRYRGFQTEHFWGELGQELLRLEYLFRFAYIESLRTKILFSEAVMYELPKISAYLEDPSKYDKVRLLFQFVSASALDSGVSIPPMESVNL